MNRAIWVAGMLLLGVIPAAADHAQQPPAGDFEKGNYKVLPDLIRAYQTAPRPEKLRILEVLGRFAGNWREAPQDWSKTVADFLSIEAGSSEPMICESALRSLCLLRFDIPVPFSDRCSLGNLGLPGLAGTALKRVGKERWAVLSNLLEDSNPKVFYWAASTLLGLNTHSAPNIVLERLSHPSPEMRAAAAWLVGFNRLSEGVPGVEALLDDPDQLVRDVAVEAFREHLYEWKVHEPMIARFSSLSLRQKLSVLKLERGEMFDNSKLGPAAFADADEAVKAGGMRILWTCGKHFGIEFLSQGLISASPAMRLQSARLILSDFKPQANDLLRPLLSDPDPEVRERATEWFDR